MSYPVYRHKPSTPWQYPNEIVRTMAPQILNWRRIACHWFKLRHADPRGSHHCKNAIRELRRIDAGSGYSRAAAQVNTRAAA